MIYCKRQCCWKWQWNGGSCRGADFLGAVCMWTHRTQKNLDVKYRFNRAYLPVDLSFSAVGNIVVLRVIIRTHTLKQSRNLGAWCRVMILTSKVVHSNGLNRAVELLYWELWRLGAKAMLLGETLEYRSTDRTRWHFSSGEKNVGARSSCDKWKARSFTVLYASCAMLCTSLLMSRVAATFADATQHSTSHITVLHIQHLLVRVGVTWIFEGWSDDPQYSKTGYTYAVVYNSLLDCNCKHRQTNM